MWISSRGDHVTDSAHTRAVALAVFLLAGIGLSACSAASAPPRPQTTTNSSAVAPLPDSGDVDAGTYLVTGFTVPFEITVPDGWQSFGWGVLKEEGGEWGVFLNFQSPRYVPPDGCTWERTLVEIDPSPEAFAEAMAAQTSSVTTPPIEITMGEFSGLEFDYAVESDVDITACDHQRFCLYSDIPQCGRVYSAVIENETERVLDLNGDLALIAVGEFMPVSPTLTAEARAVFDSIAFRSDE